MKKEYVLKTTDVSTIIPFFRIKAGLTIEDVMKKLNISRPTWEKYEKEPSRIRGYYLDDLTELFGEDFIDFYMDNKLYRK